MKKIGFLGFGNMASAIAKGILAADKKDITISAYDPTPIMIDQLNRRVLKSDSALQLVDNNKYIFLSVKPQMLLEALEPIVDHLTSEHVIISILAGVTVESIRKIVNDSCVVIRTMPNIPLLMSLGVTAIAKPDNISDSDYSFVKEVFGYVGSVYEIESNRFNEVIPINGSSPAFVYLFTKIITEQAVKYGFDYSLALEMISKTLIGSAKMMLETDKTLDELISMVSSKGGTTVAALEKMQEDGFVTSLENGFTACINRAYELGK